MGKRIKELEVRVEKLERLVEVQAGEARCLRAATDALRGLSTARADMVDGEVSRLRQIVFERLDQVEAVAAKLTERERQRAELAAERVKKGERPDV